MANPNNKSDVRHHAEVALAALDINPTGSYAFVDKSKSGHRIKFSFLVLDEAQIDVVQRVVQALNPTKQIRVWNHDRTHSMGYYGLCVKIFG